MADFEIRPKTVSLSGNQTQAFEAVRDGQPVKGLRWSILPSRGSGTIDPDTGIYSAPRFVLVDRKAYVQATQRGEPAAVPAVPPPPVVGAAPVGAPPPAPAAAGAQPLVANAGGGGQPDAEAAIATVELGSIQLWTHVLGAYWMVGFVVLLFLLLYLWNGLCPTCRLKINPPIVTLIESQPQVFTASTDVSWSAPVQPNGLFTPNPNAVPDQHVTVTATSTSDPKKSASADIFLSKDLGLSVHPQDAQVQTGCAETGKHDCRIVLMASTTGAPGAGVPATPTVIEWLQPPLGHIDPVDRLTASFDAEKVRVERPTNVLILARIKGAMSRVAGAWITVLPRKTGMRPFGWHADDCASDMIGILTLIAIMGALGGIIHGISSFTTFVGNRELKTSWMWWYFLKPFLGAAVALVVYLVFRSGFGGNDLSLGSADCVKVAALAGLIGLFAELATIKLGDIFNTLFTPKQDPRQDAAGTVALHLESLDPVQVTAGQTQPLSLRILGTGFTSGSMVKIGDTANRKPAHTTATQLDVSLEPGDMKTPQDLAVVVVNDGQRSNSLVLKVIAPGGAVPGGAAPAAPGGAVPGGAAPVAPGGAAPGGAAPAGAAPGGAAPAAHGGVAAGG
jgi:hypothetical protein